jgi:hypothetical protein
MDFFQIINDIAKVDPEVYDRFDTRRAAFRNFLGFGKKVSAAALPLAMSTLFNKAYGQTNTLPQPVIDTLKLALQLEYLEFFFYDTALASTSTLGLTPDERRAFEIIRNDEQLHINTLRSTLGATNAGPALTRADFDYTGSQNRTRTSLGAAPLFTALGGSNPTTGGFTDKAVFLTVAQNFVDTGVRAYKGGAPFLNTTTTKDILEVALNIHSVEARHSSRIRSIRRGGIQSTSAPKSWITPDETTTATPLPNNGVANTPAQVSPYLAGNPAAMYPAESNVTQATANVQSLVPTGGSATAGAEAFDEPLDAPTVKAIAKNFAANPAALFN